MNIISANFAKTLPLRSLAKYGLPFLGIAVLFLILVAYEIYVTRLTAKAAAVTNANNLTLVLESKLNDEFAAAERTVSAMVSVIEPDAMRPEMADQYRPQVTRWLKGNIAYVPSASALRYFAANGDRLYSSVDDEPPLNIADLPHFQQIKPTPAGAIIFSEVISGRITGRVSIIVDKAVRDNERTFLGMAAVAIDLTSLNQHFRNIDVGKGGVVALRRLDNGASIVRFPGPIEVDNKPTPDLPVRHAILNDGPVGVLHITSRIDGSERIYGYRKIGKFPLFIAVGLADSDYMAEWRRNSALQLVGAALFLAMLAAVFSRLAVVESRRDKSETKLRDAEMLLREVEHLSKLGGWKYDCATGSITWTDEVYRIHGVAKDYDPSNPENNMQFYAPKDAKTIAKAFGKAVNDGEPYDLELRIIRSNGDQIWVRTTGTPLMENGKVVSVIGNVVDITDRKSKEDEYRTIIQTSTDGFWMTDSTGRILDVNESICRILGYSREELLRMSIADIEAEESVEEIVARTRKIMTEGGVVFAARHRSKDRDVIDVEVSVQYVASLGERFFVFIRDISERKRAEMELRKLSHAVEQSPSSIVITNPAGNIEYVNPRFEEVTGYTKAETIGRNPRILKSGITPAKIYTELWKAISEGGEWRGELCNRKKNGEFYWEYAAISGLKDDSGQVSHYIAVKEDITERKRLEGIHLQAQKLESLGTLSGGIAHDFNNILAAIRGNADLAAADVGPDHIAAQSLEEIRKASARASDLVRRIMAFGRPTEAHRTAVDLSVVVGEVLQLLRSTLSTGISLRREFSKDTPQVLADAGQIHEVIVNLTTNAAYAIGPHAGSIKYRLEPVEVGEALARSIPGIKEGRYARLTVADSGCGMDAATVERIFDAFYTTKPVGEGTGLGLSMVHGTMRSHGGVVTVESTPGKGSSFALYFPAAKEKAVKEDESAPAQVQLLAGQRVLYLDDEEALVLLASRMLSRFGHQISGFTDPVEALDVFRVRPQDFDVVVTDLSMPHMSGFEFAGEVLAVRPGMPVLMMTGHLDVDDESNARTIGIREVILKPTTMDELGLALDRLLRGTGSTGKPSG